ncbi:hypothetical protein [Cryobacterium tagatosivorans]|uniref:Uncharacterized protein n=1 Tax=Cryobacterium tagatosivorans TaxID=1259199 RepID=A0A4R8UI03_9MICO|nr:hypothetical protein [Cryobacterium tagatosivorans]TFB53639.1 hypothetical protein E3O23_04745 [Cryobacterium tagatosivorans]
MSDLHSTATAAQTGPWATRVEPRRKAPKTDEQLFADAEKRMGVLRAKVIANRDRQRMELVDDLYAKYSVEAVADDMSESKRLVTLRAKLGL